MTMSCTRFRSSLTMLTENDIAEGLRARMLAHAGACPGCAVELDLQAELVAAIAESPLADPPVLYFEGVLAEVRLKLEVAPRPMRIRRSRGSWRPALATGLTAAMAMMWFSAVLTTVFPGGFGFERGSSGTPQVTRADATLYASASTTDRIRLVRDPRLGRLLADARLFELQTELLEEIGIMLAVASATTQGVNQ